MKNLVGAWVVAIGLLGVAAFGVSVAPRSSPDSVVSPGVSRIEVRLAPRIAAEIVPEGLAFDPAIVESLLEVSPAAGTSVGEAPVLAY